MERGGGVHFRKDVQEAPSEEVAFEQRSRGDMGVSGEESGERVFRAEGAASQGPVQGTVKRLSERMGTRFSQALEATARTLALTLSEGEAIGRFEADKWHVLKRLFWLLDKGEHRGQEWK